MKNFIFLVTLDDEQSHVIREIGIAGSSHLEELHEQIVEAFGLNKGEMASFYFSNDEWEQLDEIPMMAFDENALLTMAQAKVADIFSTNNRLLYVYDFFNMWTFYIELKESGADKKLGVLNSIGILPAVAPNKNFGGNDPVMEGYMQEGQFHSPDGDMEFDDEDFDAYNDEDEY